MSEVVAPYIGKLSTLLGWDGANFRAVSVNADGKLETHVITSGLPAGAATEATLATMATEAKLELVRMLLVSLDSVTISNRLTLLALLGELQLKADLTETQPVSAATLPLPAGASTYAGQASMLTSLQRIDDLRDALYSVGLDALAVNVGLSVLPTGAATAVLQSNIQDGLVKQVGYSLGQVMVSASNLDTPAASTLLLIDGPPAGDVWVITAMEAHNDKSAESGIYMGLRRGATWFWVATAGTRLLNEGLSWSGEVVVTEAEDLVCYHLNCTLHDDIFFNVYGHIQET